MLMVVIDVAATVSNVLNFFGTSAKDAPTVRLINMDTGKKFAGDFTVAALRQLCQDVVDGVAKVTNQRPGAWYSVTPLRQTQ